MYKLILIILPFSFLGCGSSSTGNINPHTSSQITVVHDQNLKLPTTNPCADNQFYRLKTQECIDLKHPDWGFQGFDVPVQNVYRMQTCQESELEGLIENMPTEGGKIIMPECTIETYEGIVLGSNIILEGAGVGKTILSNHSDSAVSLHGHNIIVRNFTVEGNSDSLNGINGYKNKGNILVEFIEARNFQDNQGAGISFLTQNRLENSRVTVRYCSSYGQLHGIVAKVQSSAKMLIYSNNAYANHDYGLDISSSADFEVAGNFLHDNHVAGAKSPRADNILYRYNDVNYNGKADSSDRAGIVYPGSNPSATLTLEYNDLTNNGGQAFACWSAKLDHIILRQNKTANSTDSNGYNIGVVGANLVDVYGDNGKIWARRDGSVKVVYH